MTSRKVYEHRYQITVKDRGPQKNGGGSVIADVDTIKALRKYAELILRGFEKHAEAQRLAKLREGA